MNDALVVGVLERLRDLPRDLERLVDGNGTAGEPLLQILALDQLEREEGLAARLLEPVDRGDVGMVERREHVRLALEAGEPLRVPRDFRGQDLDRDVAVQVRVSRAIDLAHPAGAERRGDPVVGEALANHQSGAIFSTYNHPMRRSSTMRHRSALGASRMRGAYPETHAAAP